jgi:hypothetical protein
VVCGGADVVAGGCAGCVIGEAGGLVVCCPVWPLAGWLVAGGGLVVGLAPAGWAPPCRVVVDRLPPGCAPATDAR